MPDYSLQVLDIYDLSLDLKLKHFSSLVNQVLLNKWTCTKDIFDVAFTEPNTQKGD